MSESQRRVRVRVASSHPLVLGVAALTAAMESRLSRLLAYRQHTLTMPTSALSM